MKKIFTFLAAVVMFASFAFAESVTTVWTLGEKVYDDVQGVTTENSGLSAILKKGVNLNGKGTRKPKPSAGEIVMTSWQQVEKGGYNADAYIDFVVTPSDRSFSPSKFEFDVAGAKTGNARCAVEVRYSTTVKELAKDVVVTRTNENTDDASLNFHQSYDLSDIVDVLEPITFRIYFYSSNKADGSAREFGLANVTVSGNISDEIADTRVFAPISWNPAEKTISIEDAKTFSPVLEGAEGLVGIVYSSDNELVATVDEAGKVAFTGKSGKVIITATYPGDETYKPTTVKSVVSVELGKEIKVGEVVLPVGAIGEEVANGTSVKYIVAANTEIFADANITVTNKTATLRAADSKNICGADLSNYIQIRNQNDENTELVITPKANMELVVYGRLQDRATDMPEVQNTKNITLTEDGASALAGTLYFSEWLAGTEAKPYEYFLMGQSFNLEAGKTYTLSASGFGFRLYGFSYTAEALPSIEAPGHDQYGDIVQADGEQVVTFTPAVEGHVIYTCFVPAVVDNAMTLAADATIEHDGKTFSLAADNKVTVSTSGTLHYFAMEPASGIKSEVKTIEFAISTAITDINVDNANAPVEYFNLQGIRVENPANGLYIRRQGNKVEKVYVK